MKVFISSVRPAPTRSKRGAFSLLEVAFALVIFVIGAIALLRIFPGGLSVLEDSGNRRVAAQMSQDVVTSYTSGDLASTTPEAIYNSKDDRSGDWEEYYASPLGLRRQKETLPVGSDDLLSSKDKYKHIRGEKQGISQGVVYTNYAADRRVDLVREGSVKNVDIAANGQMDFRNAVYDNNQRTDAPNLPFREPILNISSILDGAGTTAVPLNGDTAVIQRPVVGAAAATYDITFSLDSAIASYPVDVSSSSGSAIFNANGTDCTSAPLAASPSPDTKKFQVRLTVPAVTSAPAQPNQTVFYSIKTISGVSVSREYYTILISSDGAASPPPISGKLLPVRAPLGVRQSNNVGFYGSYNYWTRPNTMSQKKYEGVVSQPMPLPTDDNSNAVVLFATLKASDIINDKAAVVANPNSTLTFRQPLVSVNIGADRSRIPPPLTSLNFTFADSDGNAISSSNLSQVSLDYDVRSWEYVSEDVSKFGTPYTGSTTFIDTNTPDGLAQYSFVSNAGYANNNQIPSSDLREVRTRLGNLRGIVQIKGFYNQSEQSLDLPAFDSNSSELPATIMTSVTPQQFLRQKRSLAKQGRLYIPASNAGAALSHARVYYRSKDAWAQQVSVVPEHYVPFIDDKTIPHDPWREYYQGTDNFLYFHASEAGKTVECLRGTSPADMSTQTVEIKPDVVFVDALPAGIPANFTTAKFVKPGDPRNNKFYLARSRDTVSSNIFDVRRPTGTSGISVRTLWLNNDRYSQELAQ